MNRIHSSRAAARTALSEAGYKSAYSPTGSPELWVRPGDNDRKAVARALVDDVDYEWRLVEYPDGGVSGAVLSAGVDTFVPEDSGDWLG